MLGFAFAIGVAIGAGLDAPPISDAELAARCASLRAADAPARLAAAQRIAALGPSSYETLVRRLGAPREASAEALRRLVLTMWGQVPNWKAGDPMWIRKPEPPWTPPPRQKGQPRPKRPPPHDPETLDWLPALNDVDVAAAAQLDPVSTIPLERGQKPFPPDPTPLPPPSEAELTDARGDALEVVALMRAIARSLRMDAVDPIFRVAFESEGVFRDECGRQLRAMESAAVPALIRLMHVQGPPQLHLSKQRRYASYQLDRMDRARPQKAISAAPDDRVRSAIVHAYGEERALEAVEAILAQVDAPSHRVRKEARWAWLRYVTGPAPPPAPTRKRKLPGGREEEEEKPDYLTYREIATLALQKELAGIAETTGGAPPDPKADAAAMTDALFIYYDTRHAAEWDQQFVAAQEIERRGELEAAVAAYGAILAHDPDYPRRGEMVGAFMGWGDRLRATGDWARAVGFYRQAADLDPGGRQAVAATARVALCDGMIALGQGRGDTALFRRALQLDGGLGGAREGLARARSLDGRRRWLRAARTGAAALAMALLLWLLWRRGAAAS